MRDQEILDLPVEHLTDNDAVLFLWVTMPRLPLGFEVIKKWGFTFKTCGFTWIKLNSRNRKPFFGVGYYTKSNAEICLIGTRGKVLKPAVNSISSAILEADEEIEFPEVAILSERREHSKKPDEARRRIEAMYPDIPKLELFAREKAPGWDIWGNELMNDIEMPQVLTHTIHPQEAAPCHYTQAE